MHILAALGLIVWGLVVLATETRSRQAPPAPPTAGSRFAGLLLILPCPICLSAMTFTTWAALSTLPDSSPLLLGLGLAMIVVGLYFVGSLLEESTDGQRKNSVLVQNQEHQDGGGTMGCQPTGRRLATDKHSRLHQRTAAGQYTHAASLGLA